MKQRKARELIKIEIVKANYTVFQNAYEIDSSHKGYRNKYGAKVVELFRKKIGYKSTTYDGDIYYHAISIYKELNNAI
jgi:hypothetical protein